MVSYLVDNVNDAKVLNEFRKHLITQFENQATGKKVSASIAKTKHETDKNTHKAESYEFVVECLRAIEFKIKIKEAKVTKMCPDTQARCEENCSQMDCHLKLSKAGLFDIDT